MYDTGGAACGQISSLRAFRSFPLSLFFFLFLVILKAYRNKFHMKGFARISTELFAYESFFFSSILYQYAA